MMRPLSGNQCFSINEIVWQFLEFIRRSSNSIDAPRIRVADGMEPSQAATEAGATRLRPFIMTAPAMIVGMIPMSLGLGEGGEQNAPLGRAVIGGLSMATLFTLIFVPVVFSMWRNRSERLLRCQLQRLEEQKIKIH